MVETEMKPAENNYAFIDSQNVHKGVKSLGWVLDWRRFRVYLADKYKVKTAYLFIGFMPEHNDIYDALQKAGFVMKFKPVLPNGTDGVKGNVDADMVLQVMIDYVNYDKAVLVTSDGDFYSLARYLYDNKKLEGVLSPHIKNMLNFITEVGTGENVLYEYPCTQNREKKKHRLRTEP